VEYVLNHVHDSKQLAIFHIRTTVVVPDFKKWQAFVPTKSKIPDHLKEYLGCIIFIKQPSQYFFMLDLYSCNKFIECNLTKKSISVTNTALSSKVKTDCHFTYTALLFPEGIKLDNTIWSKKNNLKHYIVPMRCKKNQWPIPMSI